MTMIVFKTPADSIILGTNGERAIIAALIREFYAKSSIRFFGLENHQL